MDLTHLLDTSAIIDERLLPLTEDARLATSIVCVGELHAAVLLASTEALRAERLVRLTDLRSAVAVLAADDPVAAAYGELRAATRRIGSNDLWIAATAKAHGLVLVTRDQFLARLPGVETLLV